MLSRLRLQNYRGFRDHTVSFQPLTVTVGRNNAGKSTIVEALRLISVVTDRLGGLHFRDPPSWSDLPLVSRGVRPSLEGLGIDFLSICHRYEEPPAIIEATFATGETIKFHVNANGECHVLLLGSDSTPLRSRRQVRTASFPHLHILPLVAPLARRETILTPDHVRRNLSSPLAPRHFRNQLRLLSGPYRAFRTLAEDTWPGLQVRSLLGARGVPGDDLSLEVRDRDFVAEVARMGHGLQMWLQTMWFLARTPNGATVVLDEPDVYMHPDLQRRLIRLVRDRFDQVIVATHSVEIMAEVAPSEVLIIDRASDVSAYANSEPAVQSLIERLGGVHNIHLARLWTAKRCLLVEGKDVAYLKLVHDLLFPDADLPLDDLPNMSIGGWGGWNYAVGSALFIGNSLGEDVAVYCVLDSDYHTEAAVQRRLKQASERNVRLHVWRRKELENYFLVPAVVARVIGSRKVKGPGDTTEASVAEQLDAIADALRDDTLDAVAQEFYSDNKPKGIGAANRQARAVLEDAFASRQGKLAVVSGKKVLGELAEWSEKKYGVSLGAATIIRAMKPEEVPAEVRTVIEAIQGGHTLSGQWHRETGAEPGAGTPI